MDISHNYYVLVILPIGIIIISVLLLYVSGLKILPSLFIGLILSLITIILLHGIKFDTDIMYNFDNIYFGIYVIINFILICLIGVFLLHSKINKKTLCRDKVGTESTEETDPFSASIAARKLYEDKLKYEYTKITFDRNQSDRNQSDRNRSNNYQRESIENDKIIDVDAEYYSSDNYDYVNNYIDS